MIVTRYINHTHTQPYTIVKHWISIAIASTNSDWRMNNLHYWITRSVCPSLPPSLSVSFPDFSSSIVHPKCGKKNIFAGYCWTLCVVINFPLFAEDSKEKTRHIEVYSSQIGKIISYNFIQWNDWHTEKKWPNNCTCWKPKTFCVFFIIVICKWKCLILTRFCYRLLPFLQISQFQKMKKKNELTVKAVCIYVWF